MATSELAALRPELESLGSREIIANKENNHWLSGVLQKALTVDDPQANCVVETIAHLFVVDSETIAGAWNIECAREPSPTVRSELFYEKRANHLHFVTWIHQGERYERILDAHDRTFTFQYRHSGGNLVSYIGVGFGHVLEGLDHICFVLALMLLGGGFWRIVVITSGFTLGHSVTLALASLELVHVDEGTIEVLVALSVTFAALSCFFDWLPTHGKRRVVLLNIMVHAAAAIALFDSNGAIASLSIIGSAVFTSTLLVLQNEATSSLRVRAVLALAFGLIHGFAFAGAFTGMLSGSSTLTSLFGFNLGVEMGQIAVIVIALSVLYGLQRAGKQQWHDLLCSLSAATILALGINWTFLRIVAGN